MAIDERDDAAAEPTGKHGERLPDASGTGLPGTALIKGLAVTLKTMMKPAITQQYPHEKPDLPAYLWLRLVTAERLLALHRHHLGTKMRDAGQEVSLLAGGPPAASTHSLANLLLGRLTSPTQAAVRAERQVRLQEALNGMDPLDREILALRHFEELSNAEAAQVLGIKPSAAVNRYVRALKRLKDVFQGMPGGIEGIWG